tara:strand:+ start:644 stop:1423 length:780 start_codon:yes stop_codon:yes gene_type:complete
MLKQSINLAYVIGGSGTIGGAIVKKFLDNNIKVVILDVKFNKPKKNIENLSYYRFDLKKIESINKYLRKCIKKYGCPNILINAAYPVTKKWAKINYDNLQLNDLRNNIEFHLNSSAWCSILIARQMKIKKIKGSILFINSIYGVLAQDNNLYKNTNININPIYSLIKSSLVGFSKNLAGNYGLYGIRSNTIISGGLEGKIAGSYKKQLASFKKKYRSKTFLNRMAFSSDISSAAYFLSCEESSYITGTEVYVDGGYSAK